MNRYSIFKLLFFVGLCALISACAAYDYSLKADRIAYGAKLSKEKITAGQFNLLTYSRIKDEDKILNIYIEGDGHAFNNHGFISYNPTPHNPVALRLASVDESSNVLYIARPYQYVDINADYSKINKYWTSHRYSDEVISSIDMAINQYCSKYNIKQVKLIGFSGGGTIAALLAARRHDVQKLVTVAGNLNTKLHSQIHEVAELHGSLNPIDSVAALKNIRQTHYAGFKDKIVPKQIAETFIDALDTSEDIARIVIVKDNTHSKGWLEFWRRKEGHHE